MNDWDEQEAMIGEQLARTTQIEWGYNCLTSGVHHGRPEAIWNIPLTHAVSIFQSHTLKSLVLTRIYRDALQITLHNEEYTTQWANRVRAHAEERYDRTLQNKVGEISKYYNTPEFQLEIESAVRRVLEDKLNPHYKPLHPHDSINMLCRVVGTHSSIKASQESSES